MVPKRALCIHDMSTIGRCSLTVISPVLSTMGIQVVALPTAVLSTHFGGFGTPAMQDLTSFCSETIAHYKRLDEKFDCVFSGFLSSPQQMQIVKDAFKLSKGGLKLCDPVMADHGKLYSSITPELIEGFKDLCHHSDLIVPNPTEAQILLDRDYTKLVFSKEEATEIVKALGDKYNSVIITGTKFDDGSVCCVGYDKKENEVFFIPLNYTPVSYPGTGDMFGACLAANILDGCDLKSACKNSARFIEKVVEETYKTGSDTKYGVHIEPMLKYLIK